MKQYQQERGLEEGMGRGNGKAFTLRKSIFKADKLEIGEKRKTQILMELQLHPP